MRAAIVQHDLKSPPGTIIDWLEKSQIQFKLFQLFEKIEFPELEDFDLLILCGGSMNVDQEDKVEWLLTEKKLIKGAISANKKIIGLCLGAQLCAEGLGAKVSRHVQSELGWHSVEFFEDMPLKSNAQTLQVFQFHSYTFELPQGAILLASNSACCNQAFLYKNNILGFQFHPETTTQWVVECSLEPNQPTGEYCQSPEVMRELAYYQPELQRWFFDYLDQFMRLN